MKKKAILFFLATITSASILFTGCKNKETETTPVVGEAIEEIEATEPEEVEPMEEVEPEIEKTDSTKIKRFVIIDQESLMVAYEQTVNLYEEVANLIEEKGLKEDSLMKVLEYASKELDEVSQHIDPGSLWSEIHWYDIPINSSYFRLQHIKDFINGTTKNDILTQAKIDELKANATTDRDKHHIEEYEAIINTGSYTLINDNTPKEGSTYTRAVGKPDGSWRRMTDEEAEAILAKGESAEGYYAAEAELEGASWFASDFPTGTIYFDYYAYVEEIVRPAIEKQRLDELKDCEETINDMLENPEVYLEATEAFGKIVLPKWAIEELGVWDTLPEKIKGIIELY